MYVSSVLCMCMLVYVCMLACMGGWMDDVHGCVWMNGWMDGYPYVCMCAMCTSVSVNVANLERISTNLYLHKCLKMRHIIRTDERSIKIGCSFMRVLWGIWKGFSDIGEWGDFDSQSAVVIDDSIPRLMPIGGGWSKGADGSMVFCLWMSQHEGIGGWLAELDSKV
jgi:hypothetical protein